MDNFEVCSFKTRKSQGLSLSWNSNQLTTWAHKCQFDCLRAEIKHKILTQASDDGGGQTSGSSAAAAAAAAAAQRKMDKTTVLLATIDFLKKHNEAAKNPAGTNSEKNTHRFVKSTQYKKLAVHILKFGTLQITWKKLKQRTSDS